jgi:hypothetical protein
VTPRLASLATCPKSSSVRGCAWTAAPKAACWQRQLPIYQHATQLAAEAPGDPAICELADERRRWRAGHLDQSALSGYEPPRTLLGVKCLFDQTAQVWSAVRWSRIAARPDGPGAPVEQLRASGTFQPRARPAGSRTPPLLGICSWTRPTTRTSSLSATKDRYRGRPATAIDRPSMARGPVHRGVPQGSAAGLPGSSPASLLDSGPDMSPRAARESGRRCGIDRHRQPARCGMMGRSRR